jgi:photosystem II stability/assembly factor-like uncharacterized protein
MFSVRKPRLVILGVLWASVFILPAFAAQVVSRRPRAAVRDNLYDVAIHKESAWIVGYYGTILRSRDRGRTWTKQQSGTTEALFRILFRSENYGWACGSYGTLLRTEDGGATWRTTEIPVEEQLLGLDFIESHGVAVGSRGAVLVTEDGGASWANYSLGDDVTLNDVRFIDIRRGWAVGEFGRIYYTQDGGKTWVKQKSPIEVDLVSGESRSLFRLLLGNSHTAWSFGLDGTILNTRDGETWKVVSPADASSAAAKKNHLFAAAAFGGKGWAVGERGALVVSTLEKNDWLPVNLKAPPSSLNGIAFGNGHLGLIVGNRGLVLRSEDAGSHWQPLLIFPEEKASGVYPDR